jgi:hypothetical protein
MPMNCSSVCERYTLKPKEERTTMDFSVIIWTAMISSGIWERPVEGDNA